MVVIEHNLDVVKSADWVIDLGPEGGDEGGSVVAVGTPEQVGEVSDSYTGKFLREVLGEAAVTAPPRVLRQRQGYNPQQPSGPAQSPAATLPLHDGHLALPSSPCLTRCGWSSSAS